MMQFQSGYSNTNEEKKASESTYHDPLTKTTYVWDSEKNTWKPKTMQYNYPDNYRYTDPNSGCTYAWNAEKQSWKLVENDPKVLTDKETDKSAEATGTSNSEKQPTASSNLNQGN